MLNFRPVEITDKELFNKYMKGRGYRHFDASFANMFILSKEGDIRIAEDDGAFYVIQNWRDYTPFMLPPYTANDDTDIEKCISEAGEYMKKNFGKAYFKFVIPEQKYKFEKLECVRSFVYDSYNSEYIYKTEDLISLSGKKYHGKRNHLKKFISNYDCEFLLYTPDLAEACIDIERKWMEERGGAYDLECEYTAIYQAVKYFGELDLTGCVLKVDGKYAGFSFAERINGDTALIHIEKCLSGYDGIYQYINNEFLKRCFADTVYVNRAEDMGIEGLRRAKQSYYPCCMAEKYDMLLI